MATTATTKQAPALAQEQIVALHHISWQTYECLLADHEDASAPRFTYDRGELEIMSPRSDYEQVNRALASLVEVVGEEQQIEFNNLGSTTFKRQDLERGFEPDSCFYFENELAIRGKSRIDLSADPPPDLIIEIDVTHSSLDRFAIFAALGVPEVWRYEGGQVAFLILVNAVYAPSTESRALPGVLVADVSDLIAAVSSSGRVAWLRRVREWARSLPRE